MWFKWLLIGLILLGMVGNIRTIDKPRQPLTAAGVALNTLINVLSIVGLLHYWK